MGYTVFPGQTITIQAVYQNTGNLVTRGTATSATSGIPSKTPGGTNYTLYPWSFDAGVLPANFWSPQPIVADLATSQGHLEIFASALQSFLFFWSYEKTASTPPLASRP